jgi:hypothetical protein
MPEAVSFSLPAAGCSLVEQVDGERTAATIAQFSSTTWRITGSPSRSVSVDHAIRMDTVRDVDLRHPS